MRANDLWLCVCVYASRGVVGMRSSALLSALLLHKAGPAHSSVHAHACAI